MADELILSAEKKILEESSEVSSIWICRLGRFIGKSFRSQFVRNFPITLTEAHSLPSTSFFRGSDLFDINAGGVIQCLDPIRHFGRSHSPKPEIGLE